MFNAKITFRNLGGEWRERTVAPVHPGAVRKNEAITRDLLASSKVSRKPVNLDVVKHGPFDALTATLVPAVLRKFLLDYRWLPGFEKTLTEVNEYLAGTGEYDPEIETWLFLAPQQKSSGNKWECGGSTFDVRERSRIESEGRYKVYSEPDHRLAAEYFAGTREGKVLNGGTELRLARQAVLLFYAVRSKEENAAGTIPTMGFALLFPSNHISRQISFTVADPSRSEAVVVPKLH